MRKISFFGFLACMALVLFLLSVPSAMAASDEEAVLQVAQNWEKAFNSNDYKAWSSLWWNSPKTTQFGPPKQMAFLSQGYEEITGLITGVFESPKGTYTSSVHNPRATMLGSDVAVLTCYQTMSINPPAVAAQIIEQHRITFVLQKISGKWLIVHAHGSLLPVE